MRISPKYTAFDWKELNFLSEDEWLKAIDIFHDRINERFLYPISLIEETDYSGFAVLALDCLLIEMLQQFYRGVYRTPAGKSKEYFVSFLTETRFGEFYDNRQAELFYRQIRCGILHQAEIRGSSRVLADPDTLLVRYSDDNRGLIVNRRKFHQLLMQEISEYTERLKDPANKELRSNFRKKMVSICRTACEII
nr:hypothetical protein [candidate division Zixibacteria bacterium]